MDAELRRLNNLTRHLDHVRDNCNRLSAYFQEIGEPENAAEIVRRGYRHDHSKFSGVEWLWLNSEAREQNPAEFAAAVELHHQNNDHHPEYWGSIHYMPRPALAEFVCDILARSQEFGSDVWDWVLEVAMPRYGLTQDSPTYDQVVEFLNFMLERRFS